MSGFSTTQYYLTSVLRVCRALAVGSQFNTARVDLLADVVLQRFVHALDLPPPDPAHMDGPKDAPNNGQQLPSTSQYQRAKQARPVTERSKTTAPHPPPIQHSSAVSSGSTSGNHASHLAANESSRECKEDQNVPSDCSISRTKHGADAAAVPLTDEDALSLRNRNGSNEAPPSNPHDASTPPRQQSARSHAGRLPSLASLQRPQRVRSLLENPALPPLLKSHTALFLHVASDVLFNMHGYRCASWSFWLHKAHANMTASVVRTVHRSRSRVLQGVNISHVLPSNIKSKTGFVQSSG